MATKTNNRGSITVQYEDFKPISEWKEEEGANILLLHLPDFQKEQMKITYDSTGRIRVVGERPMNNNKCKRFNEAFSVPQNCNVQKILAKFQNSTLTITMPKMTPAIPTKPSSASTTPTKQSANDNKLQNDEIKGLKPKDPPISEAQAPPTLTDDATDEKKAEEQPEENNGKKRKESSAASSKESIKKSKEANDSEKEKDDLFGEKVKNVTTAAKKTVMGFARELSEDKQSLVNISVAVLVIAALGAYISYNYGSSGNSRD